MKNATTRIDEHIKAAAEAAEALWNARIADDGDAYLDAVFALQAAATGLKSDAMMIEGRAEFMK